MSAGYSAFPRTLTGGHTTAGEAAKRAVDELKRAAATWAVSQLKDGMIVGLCSRSAAPFAVSAIGKLVKEGLRINKLVTRLGSRAPVPVEVVQFGWESTGKRLAALGSRPILRNAADQKAFITDSRWRLASGERKGRGCAPPDNGETPRASGRRA
jgi:hypothetical protein